MLRAIVFFIVLVLVGAFALLNWDAFTALTPLSLGVTTVHAPLGLIMLGLVVFLSLLFTVWVIALQGTALLDARRQTRELQTQRDLADKAEASRFTELRADLIARMNEHANATAAYFGQLEDRLERARLLPPEADRPAPPAITPR
jgi:uncharacterized integral membrane protein